MKWGFVKRKRKHKKVFLRRLNIIIWRWAFLKLWSGPGYFSLYPRGREKIRIRSKFVWKDLILFEMSPGKNWVRILDKKTGLQELSPVCIISAQTLRNILYKKFNKKKCFKLQISETAEILLQNSAHFAKIDCGFSQTEFLLSLLCLISIYIWGS